MQKSSKIRDSRVDSETLWNITVRSEQKKLEVFVFWFFLQSSNGGHFKTVTDMKKMHRHQSFER